MDMSYAWFTWSLILLAIWAIVYFSLQSRESRHEMVVVSFGTSLLGLTEPLFVPEYWNPPSLFNLAERTGFDLESLLFAFAIGGLAVVLYERMFKIRHRELTEHERHLPRHHLHALALLSAPVVFVLLEIFTHLNPIYTSSIALVSGGFFTWYCRPDLKQKMLISALIFLVFYSLYFSTLIVMYPDYVEQVWNLKTISGILILGVPLEELIFALSFGFLWSSVYEHITWRRLPKLL